MAYDRSISAHDESDDFERWFFGGSPPADDGWDRHEFMGALEVMPATTRVAGPPVAKIAVAGLAANEAQLCQSKSVA